MIDNKYRWHDLRKDQNDLPVEGEIVLVWYEYYHWSAEKVLPEYGIGFVWRGEWAGEVSQGRNVRQLAWKHIEPLEVEDDD